MTFQTPHALAQMDIAELSTEITTAEREYYTLRMRHEARELKQPHLLRQHRRYIAQLHTFRTKIS